MSLRGFSKRVRIQGRDYEAFIPRSLRWVIALTGTTSDVSKSPKQTVAAGNAVRAWLEEPDSRQLVEGKILVEEEDFGDPPSQPGD